MLRLRDSMMRSFHQYFEVRSFVLYMQQNVDSYHKQNQGFCYAHTPIITSNDCEGAGEAFRLAPTPTLPSTCLPYEFFGEPSYLRSCTSRPWRIQYHAFIRYHRVLERKVA